MDYDEAKKANKGSVVAGSVVGDNSWILSEDLVSTTENMKISSKQTKRGIQFFNTETDELIFEDIATKQGYVTRQKDGKFLRLVKQKLKTGLNGFYLYRTTPAFVGQEEAPAEETTLDDETKKTQQSDAGENQEEEIPPLYVYGRLLVIPEQRKTTRYVMYSVVKGPNPDAMDSGLGFCWKDVYKAVRIPKFQYAAIVLDTQQNVVVKSKQENSIRTRPVFEVAAGVDVLGAILSCFPLYPDGTQIMDNMDDAVDIASLALFGF